MTHSESRPSRHRTTLADYLDLLLPATPDDLIGAGPRRRIAALASSMLPVPRIAVECRLARTDDQVDIQQCLRRDDGEFPTLASYAADLAEAHPADASLSCLRDFCDDLARPDSVLHAGIEEIYLEYDLPSAVDAPSAPAVFASLPENQAVAREVVAVATARLCPRPIPPLMQAAIDRCFAACEKDAYVSHVGWMLSRSLDVMRVNVKGLRPAQVERFLTRCEWPGEPRAAARLFDEAVNRVDRVTLALDVGEALLPRIGVECFLDETPARDPSWRVCFNELCAESLCSPSKADAFLAVPTDILPPTVARPWPTPLVMDSLARSETEFSCFARRAVHFKITETMGAKREAKAYFGAGHLWLVPSTDPLVHRWRPTLAKPRPRRSIRAHDDAVVDPIDRAVEHGVAFLLHQQLQSGLWRDFNLPNGISDEWVSGFVGTQLVRAGGARARAAAEECHARLALRQRQNGGWGYNRDHPPDSDSSSWVLRLAAALGRDDEDAARRGRDFVARHCRENGGVASYVERFTMAPHALLPSDDVLAGMLHIHDCVTGAAAPFVPDRIHRYLRERQRDGRWVGYFWSHDSYATALAVEALRARPESGDGPRVAAAEQCAIRWLGEHEHGASAMTAFDVSWCLRILVGATGAPCVASRQSAIGWLLDRQQTDGSWVQGARLRIPLTGSIEPVGGPEAVILDERRTFTTAAVVGAMAAHRAGRGARVSS